jgi:hypothetical protein
MFTVKSHGGGKNFEKLWTPAMSAPSASRSRTVHAVLRTVEYKRWRLPKDRGMGTCCLFW